MYREKKIYSGKILEVDIYPIYSSGRELPRRNPKQNISTETQKNLNDKNAKKKLVRLVNTNFTENDLAAHLTYRDDEMPSSEEEARKDFTNYIRRIKIYRKKHGLPELKYISVLECKISKRTGVLRWHFHMIMSEMNRNDAEQLWGKGDWTNTKRLQPNEYGFEQLARYIIKDPEGSKRWSQSRNLAKPFSPKPKDGKITKIAAKRMATIYVDDKTFFEKKYPGYSFLKCEPLFNDFNGMWYLSIVLQKQQTGKGRGKQNTAT